MSLTDKGKGTDKLIVAELGRAVVRIRVILLFAETPAAQATKAKAAI